MDIAKWAAVDFLFMVRNCYKTRILSSGHRRTIDTFLFNFEEVIIERILDDGPYNLSLGNVESGHVAEHNAVGKSSLSNLLVLIFFWPRAGSSLRPLH